MRMSLHEYSDEFVKGTQTHCTHKNQELISKINLAQSHIYNVLMKRIPEEFLTSVDITGSSSSYTLPWNFGRIRRFENENDYKVFAGSVDSRPKGGGSGSDRIYYRAGQTLTLTKASVSEVYTLWFYSKPRFLHHGRASADSKLDTGADIYPAARIDDYYNGMVIEAVIDTDCWYETISDYTGSTLTITLSSNTLSSDDYYGLVSELPEPFHHLVDPLATIYIKASSPQAKRFDMKDELRLWAMMFGETLAAFAGTGSRDEAPEDIWCDFGGGMIGGGINVPQQGYEILD